MLSTTVLNGVLCVIQSNRNWTHVVVQIFNATRHHRHIDAAELLCTCICTALLSWISHAQLVPLSDTKRRPVHFILNSEHIEWGRRTNGLITVSTRAGFEATTSRLKVECTNHPATQSTTEPMSTNNSTLAGDPKYNMVYQKGQKRLSVYKKIYNLVWPEASGSQLY